MPTRIDFNYVSVHRVRNNHGLVEALPALPQDRRLYVIYNNSTNRPFYIGTAANIQDRFEPRFAAMREMGMNQVALDEILIMVVQIQVDGVNTPPVAGVSGGIDVEHLLIATYIGGLNFNVRNIQKVGTFTNNTGGVLDWHLNNVVGIPNFGVPVDFILANHGTVN